MAGLHFVLRRLQMTLSNEAGEVVRISRKQGQIYLSIGASIQ
jgi:hypothetical protein